MFDIITRKEYWDWLDDLVDNKNYTGLLRRTRRNLALSKYKMGIGHEYTLKSVQDAYIYHNLRHEKGRRILEVGGGNSRVLRLLSSSNECWLVDKFEGKGHGPKRKPVIRNVRVVQDYLGQFNSLLPDQSFDYIFSISVIEHIPIASLDVFFQDCARLLKPGARMLHAIDTYICDPADRQTPGLKEWPERVRKYLEFAKRPDLGIHLVESAKLDENIQFSCRYASLPDNVLYKWQQAHPDVKREVGQVVSLKTEWVKD